MHHFFFLSADFDTAIIKLDFGVLPHPTCSQHPKSGEHPHWQEHPWVFTTLKAFRLLGLHEIWCTVTKIYSYARKKRYDGQWMILKLDAVRCQDTAPSSKHQHLCLPPTQPCNKPCLMQQQHSSLLVKRLREKKKNFFLTWAETLSLPTVLYMAVSLFCWSKGSFKPPLTDTPTCTESLKGPF